MLRPEIHCDDCGKVLSREQTVVSIIAQVTFCRCLDCTLAPEIANGIRERVGQRQPAPAA